MAARVVSSIIFTALFHISNAVAAAEERGPSHGPILPSRSLSQKTEQHLDMNLERIRQEPARYDFTACSGSSQKLLQLNSCYVGTRMGELVMVKVNDFDSQHSAGSVFVTGQGLSSVRCNKEFSLNENQILTIAGIEECLPGRVSPKTMKYCPDQDHVLLSAQVGTRNFEMVLTQTECPAEFLANMSHTPGEVLRQDVLLQENWAWNTGICTGSSDLPTPSASTCYSGNKLGEAMTLKLDSFDQAEGTGSLLVTGSRMSPMKCKRDFAKADQLITVTDFQHCLPSTLKAHGMRYCSDQDHMIVDAAVGPMTVEMLLKPSPCPSSLLQETEAAGDDLLAHSAWVWDSEGCTGNQHPPAHAPFCFTGSKMGEVVSIKVNSFDNSTGAGSVLVTGSGLAGVNCERAFSKEQQLISVPKLGDCLPSTVQPNSMKYCSDQNQVLLDAKVGIIPVQLVLIPSPCPMALAEQSSKVDSLIQSDSEWNWLSTACTGSKDPPTHAPFCYSGSKLGELVTIKVHSFDSPSAAGSVLVTGSGVPGGNIRCERSFLKAQQMISVTKLDECLPTTVTPSGLKYCSDQDRVILDATVASIPVEMVLDPTPCPAVFLEESGSSSKHQLIQGEIFASGVQRRLVRTETQ